LGKSEDKENKMTEIKKFVGSDIEIAQAVYPEYALPIDEVAKKAGIPNKYIKHHHH
jgi:formate--tetrahydrofolate ligase